MGIHLHGNEISIRNSTLLIYGWSKGWGSAHRLVRSHGGDACDRVTLCTLQVPPSTMWPPSLLEEITSLAYSQDYISLWMTLLRSVEQSPSSLDHG